MKLDLTQKLILRNLPEDQTLVLGKMISSILDLSLSGQMDAYKKYTLAGRFDKEEVIDLDEADLKALEGILKEEKRPPIVIGQIIQMIEDAKTKDKEEKEKKNANKKA